MILPNHQRSRRSFARTFERNHEQTIAAMDQGGHDIPNQAPSTPLRLKQIGVKRVAIPVLLADPFGGSQAVQLSCSVDARVSLEPGRRGIHVSRIGDLLAKLSGKVYSSLLDYATQINEQLRASQQSNAARVSVEGVLTYLEKISGVKEKASLEHLDLFAEVASLDGQTTSSSGIGFSHITACPCVQETYRNSFSPDDRSPRLDRSKKQIPLITHTQRCQTRIRFAGVASLPGLPDLLSSIDAVVVRNQNTLPREFELLNVHRSHAQPQFLEDVLRDLMHALYRLIRPRTSEGVIRIKARSMESIHDFDMEGETEFSVKELDQIFGSKISHSRNGERALNGVKKEVATVPLQKAGRKKPGRPLQTKRSPQGHSSLS